MYLVFRLRRGRTSVDHVVVTTFLLRMIDDGWWMIDHLLQGFRNGSWNSQTGSNFSVCTSLQYRDYIPVYTDGSRDGNAVACATVFPSNTVISMRLPDSASVFTAGVWAIIKTLEQIKDSIASKYIVLQTLCTSLPLQMLIIFALSTSILKDMEEETISMSSAVPKCLNKPWFTHTDKEREKEKCFI